MIADYSSGDRLAVGWTAPRCPRWRSFSARSPAEMRWSRCPRPWPSW